jgi:hypothetical protein
MAGLASINVKFRVDLKQFSTEMQSALREIDKFGQKMQSVGRGMSAAITAPILLAGGASIKLASDVEESTNKVNVAFGNSAKSVQDFSKTTLDSYGIASGTALEMASLFGDMATSMGLPQAAAAKMSTSLVGLAGDLSSFKNIGIEQAQTALAGIFTGETESLKKLGIVMTEAALQEYAYAQGIRTKVADMGQAEKVQLRYNYVLEKTKNAQGDFERTGGGAANQMRIFQEVLKELGASLGAVILPAFTKIITTVNGWLKSFNNLSEGTKTTIVVVAGLAAAIGPLLVVVGALASAIPAIVAGFAAIGVTSAAALGPISLVVAALGAIAYAIVKNWAPIKQILVNFANYFVDLYNNSVVFRSGVEYIILSFKNAWTVGKFVFNALWETIKLVGRNVFTLFSSMGKLIKAVLTFDAEGIKNAIAEGLSGGLDNIGLFFNAIKKDAVAMTSEIASNTREAINNALNGRKIEKIVIQPDKVDASAVTEAVSNAAAAGANGSGKKGNKRVQGVGSFGTAGLATTQSIGTDLNYDNVKFLNDAKIAGDASIELANKMEYLAEVGEAVGASVANAFSGLASNMLGSLGLASDGFQGFVKKMLELGIQLISMLIQNAVKNIAIRQAESMSNAIAGATSSAAATGPAAIFTTPAFIATAVGGVLAAFAAIPKFEMGGIVGGSSMFGDKLLARVNSGEMILNQGQQQRLSSLINPASTPVNITLGGGFVLDGTKLRLVLDRTDERDNRRK